MAADEQQMRTGGGSGRTNSSQVQLGGAAAAYFRSSEFPSSSFALSPGGPVSSSEQHRRLSESHPAPPHVTISSVGGSVVRYHRFPESNIEELASSSSGSATAHSTAGPSCAVVGSRDQGSSSRSWRSHSLTPTGVSSSQAGSSSGVGMSPSAGDQKVRSNSLTFGAQHQHYQQQQQHHQLQQQQQQQQQQQGYGGHMYHGHPGVHSSQPQQHSGHFGQGACQMPQGQQSIGGGGGTQSQEDQAVIDELVRRLPDGSGMRELQEWLKSLRLHKYTRLLLEFTFDELVNLNEDQLEHKSVTQGARGKILKEISLLRERRERLEGMRSAIGDDLNRIERMLPELEKIILMPLKPYQPLPLGAAVSINDPEQGENIPEMIFDALRRIYSSIFLSVSDNFNHGVLAVYVCLLERCLHKEAFTQQHKQSFNAWIRRLRSVWNPPSIRKATDYKQRKQSCGRTDLASPNSAGLVRRLSLNTGVPPTITLGGCIAPPLPPPGLGAFPRGPSPQIMMKGLSSEALGGCGSSMHRQMMNTTAGLQRRSVPEIQPLPSFGSGMYPPMKRNSYQGDHRMVPLIDSEVLSNLIDVSTLGATPHSSISSGSSSRRESTMSCDSGYYLSLPPSRRESTMSSGSGRRDSEDSREFYLTSMDEEGSRRTSVGSGVHPRRRDSAMSNDSGHGYLSVEAAGCRSTSSPGTGGFAPSPPSTTCSSSGATLAPPPVTGAAGSVSSGCASLEGSTDSLVEQDLRNLSLSVTEQLWDE